MPVRGVLEPGKLWGIARMAVLGIAMGLVITCNCLASQPDQSDPSEAQPLTIARSQQASSTTANPSDMPDPDLQDPPPDPVAVAEANEPDASATPEGPQDEIVVAAHSRVPGDPFASLNEKSFEMTASLDNAVAGPVARRYNRVVPEPVRNGIRNVFANLHEPVVFLNFFLQHKIGKAAATAGRFVINTTVGVVGLFDIAKRRPFRIPARANSFPDTLGFYGVKPGTFFYLPLLGPTTSRDFAGGFVDHLLLPVGFGAPFNKIAFNAPTGVIRGLEHRAEIDDRIRKLRNTPENNYDAAREFYLKRRQAEIDGLHGKHANAPADGQGDASN